MNWNDYELGKLAAVRPEDCTQASIIVEKGFEEGQRIAA
jgi:hypothetical protein